MKKVSAILFVLALAGAAYAQQVEFALGNGHAHPASNQAGVEREQRLREDPLINANVETPRGSGL